MKARGVVHPAIDDQFIEKSLGRSDAFHFCCTGCGKCCKDRKDILLSPYDLYRMAKHLKIKMSQVVQQYCVWYVGKTSKAPLVALKMRGQDALCPFLKENKCSIHAAKPTVCALYPLGRFAAEDDGAVRYILQNVACGARDEKHTIEDWLSGYGLEESEVWFMEWQKAILSLSRHMNAITEVLSGKTVDLIYACLLSVFYFDYKTEDNFLEQFRTNVKRADIVLTSAEEYIKHRTGAE